MMGMYPPMMQGQFTGGMAPLMINPYYGQMMHSYPYTPPPQGGTQSWQPSQHRSQQPSQPSDQPSKTYSHEDVKAALKKLQNSMDKKLMAIQLTITPWSERDDFQRIKDMREAMRKLEAMHKLHRELGVDRSRAMAAISTVSEHLASGTVAFWNMTFKLTSGPDVGVSGTALAEQPS